MLGALVTSAFQSFVVSRWSRDCSLTTRSRARALNSSLSSNLARGLPVEHVEVGHLHLVDAAHADPAGRGDIDEVLDQHAERGAPVADVVLADDLVAR